MQAAREQGPSIVQAFHESMATRGGRSHAVLCDIVAFANGKGGTVYVGASANAKAAAIGVTDPEESMNVLRSQVEEKITPQLDVGIDSMESKGKQIVRVVVPDGGDKPYALEESKIYVRQELDTNLAVRDEIVQIVRAQVLREQQAEQEAAAQAAYEAPEATPAEEAPLPVPGPTDMLEPPRTGVEIVESVERKGTLYYTMRDLRNGNTVQNVTRSSARRLWRYAITEHEKKELKPEDVTWKGNAGLLNRAKKQGGARYDLAQRDAEGKLHTYYGVSEDGVHSAWRAVVGEES